MSPGFSCLKTGRIVQTNSEVILMGTIGPKIQRHFDTLPPELQQAVLERGGQMETLDDLMRVLERIAAE